MSNFNALPQLQLPCPNATFLIHQFLRTKSVIIWVESKDNLLCNNWEEMSALPAGTPSTQQQSDQQTTGTVHPRSVTSRRVPHVSTSSTSNIFRSLSTIHRSTSVLPASLLDLDVASTAGLQVCINNLLNFAMSKLWSRVIGRNKLHAFWSMNSTEGDTFYRIQPRGI